MHRSIGCVPLRCLSCSCCRISDSAVVNLACHGWGVYHACAKVSGMPETSPGDRQSMAAQCSACCAGAAEPSLPAAHSSATGQPGGGEQGSAEEAADPGETAFHHPATDLPTSASGRMVPRLDTTCNLLVMLCCPNFMASALRASAGEHSQRWRLSCRLGHNQ